jgi:hypothetical protein
MENMSEISLYNITSWMELKDIYNLVAVPVFSTYILKFIQDNSYWQKMIDNMYQKTGNQKQVNWARSYSIFLPEYWYDFLCETNNIELMKIVVRSRYVNVHSSVSGRNNKHVRKLVENGHSLKILFEMGVDVSILLEVTCDIAQPKTTKECIELLLSDSRRDPVQLIHSACYKNNLDLIYQCAPYFNNIPYYCKYKCDPRKPFNHVYNDDSYELYIIKFVIKMRYNTNIIKDILQKCGAFGTEVIIYAIQLENQIAARILMGSDYWIPSENDIILIPKNPNHEAYMEFIILYLSKVTVKKLMAVKLLESAVNNSKNIADYLLSNEKFLSAL